MCLVVEKPCAFGVKRGVAFFIDVESIYKYGIGCIYDNRCINLCLNYNFFLLVSIVIIIEKHDEIR
jgi:hypothetical protein